MQLANNPRRWQTSLTVLRNSTIASAAPSPSIEGGELHLPQAPLVIHGRRRQGNGVQRVAQRRQGVVDAVEADLRQVRVALLEDVDPR